MLPFECIPKKGKQKIEHSIRSPKIKDIKP